MGLPALFGGRRAVGTSGSASAAAGCRRVGAEEPVLHQAACIDPDDGVLELVDQDVSGDPEAALQTLPDNPGGPRARGGGGRAGGGRSSSQPARRRLPELATETCHEALPPTGVAWVSQHFLAGGGR